MRMTEDGNKILGRSIERVLDFVFPDSLYCICCGNIIDDSRTYSICDHCMTHINWTLDKPRKIKMNYDTEGGSGSDYLSMISCTEYGIYERSIIFALKYDGHKYIARTIAEIMRDRILSDESNHLPTEGDDSWIVVPVPLHASRLASRGYNHAELIAKHLARLMKIDMKDLLERIRETRPMKGLGPEERGKNIYRSIRVKDEAYEKNADKNIVLIDDFFTTGSTALECCRAIREAGMTGKIVMLAFAAR